MGDAHGCDAYLSVEYQWDGEHYAQECGPCMVRKRGHCETVHELLNSVGSAIDRKVASVTEVEPASPEGPEVCAEVHVEATTTQTSDKKLEPVVEGFGSNSLHYEDFDDYVSALSAQRVCSEEPVHGPKLSTRFGRLWPSRWLSADRSDSKLP